MNVLEEFPAEGTKNFLLSSWILWQDLRFQLTYDTFRAKTSIHTYLLFLMCIWESSEEKWRPEEASGLKASVPFYTKNNKLWGCDRTKGLELGAVNCGTANRKCMRETDRRSRVILVDLFVQLYCGIDSQSRVIGRPPGRGRAPFSWEMLWSTCLKAERGRPESPSAAAVSEVPSARNRHDAKAAYFGAACSGPLH